MFRLVQYNTTYTINAYCCKKLGSILVEDVENRRKVLKTMRVLFVARELCCKRRLDGHVSKLYKIQIFKTSLVYGVCPKYERNRRFRSNPTCVRIAAPHMNGWNCRFSFYENHKKNSATTAQSLKATSVNSYCGPYNKCVSFNSKRSRIFGIRLSIAAWPNYNYTPTNYKQRGLRIKLLFYIGIPKIL